MYIIYNIFNIANSKLAIAREKCHVRVLKNISPLTKCEEFCEEEWLSAADFFAAET